MSQSITVKIVQQLYVASGKRVYLDNLYMRMI